jgi:predicted DNA-binding transcriptional regulator AlpA
MPVKDVLLPSEAVAERHKCSLKTVLRRMMDEPGFPQPVKRGRRYWWSLKELKAFERQYVDRFGVEAA